MAFLKKCNHYAESFDTASLQLRARAMAML